MKIMAIDASTKSTGIALFENDKLVKSDCLTCSNTDSLIRVYQMKEKILNFYEEYLPDVIIMEDVLPEDVRHNQNVFNALHYLQAYVRVELALKQKKVEFYTASHWRKLCGIRTGRGIKREELKKADIQFVKDKYGLDVNDDIADAICIGWAYIEEHKPKASIGFQLV